jgi:phosphoglycerol transferase MdoB-like AlkP superfamily enzyme
MMTTSNHRPYTYPEGKIDIPSKAGREGGIKYADYSVGRFVEQAKTKPWFKDTIFVFVADHTAGAGGKVDLNQQRYHIPLIIYAPEIIKPQQFTKLSSQIDLAPTLLGFMNMPYLSKFYGADVLNDANAPERAFISNYQKVALVKDDVLTILAPKQEIKQFSWPALEKIPDANMPLIDEAIAYYQSASWWKQHYRRIPTKQ